MALLGYRRVSTQDQSLARQELPECLHVYEEKLTGANRDRPQLALLLQHVRVGDTVVVYSIDRLARDLRDLQNIVSEVLDKGGRVEFIKENLTFTADDNDPYSRLQLSLMGAFAEFERAIILERQREGIARAKADGRYTGRKATIDVAEVARLRDEGMGASAIAKHLGIGRASVYRVLQGHDSQ